jgi:putative hydrolase of the HAD superfamily
MKENYLTHKDDPMFSKLSHVIFFILFLVGFSSYSHAEQPTKIKAVVFDFGGVIAKTDRKEVVDYIAKSLNISSDQALDLIAQLKIYQGEGKNEINFWEDYANSSGIKLPDHWLKQLNEARFRALKAIPGMVDLVKNLQKQGFQTALLSNAKESKVLIKSQLGYYELFNPALFSYKLGVSKPDPEAYHILLAHLKIPAEAILFVDNKIENVEAAKSLGMDAVLFINANQLIEDLKQRGVEVSIPNQSTPSACK